MSNKNKNVLIIISVCMCHERASRFLHNTLNVYIINDSVSVYTYFKKREKRERETMWNNKWITTEYI